MRLSKHKWTSIRGCEIVNPALALEVPFLDLKAQYRALAPEINRAIADVFGIRAIRRRTVRRTL